MTSKFEITNEDILSEGLGSRIIEEMYKDQPENLSTTNSSKEDTRPYNLTIFNMSEIIQGKPAYGSIQESLGRFEDTLGATMSGFFGQVEDSPVLNFLLPDDLHAMLRAQSPGVEGDEEEGEGDGGDSSSRSGSAEAREIIALAKGEVGYKESPPGSNRTKYAAIAGVADGLAWCSTFLKAMFVEAGHPQANLITPSTESTLDNFMAIDSVGQEPKVGALVFFLFRGNRSAGRRVNHNGIVYDWDDTHIKTVEGNTSGANNRNGGQVARRTRRMSANVAYYAYPEYREETPEERRFSGNPDDVPDGGSYWERDVDTSAFDF